ncbi:protein-disulfide reductase DsbD domain-containing protein [Pseudochelatococcus sp. B33]
MISECWGQFASGLRRPAVLAFATWCVCMAAAGAAPPLSSGLPQKAVGDAPAQVRLFPAGRDAAAGRYRAVVEIALAEGYKTYWREPGDSGVPTTFDWSASGNVADVRVRYPTPVRFFDGVGHAIGYLRTVRFPLEIAPLAGDRPAELHLDIAFGVCREICIPEQVTVAASLSDVAQIAGLWEDAVALLPAEAEPGGAATGLGIGDATLSGGDLRLAVTGDIGEGGDVFIEGPAGWQFGRPQREQGPGGAAFVVPVRHPDFDAPVELTVTLAGSTGAVETRVRLDPPR